MPTAWRRKSDNNVRFSAMPLTVWPFTLISSAMRSLDMTSLTDRISQGSQQDAAKYVTPIILAIVMVAEPLEFANCLMDRVGDTALSPFSFDNGLFELR